MIADIIKSIYLFLFRISFMWMNRKPLQNKVVLSHTFPATTSLLRPEAGAEGLGTKNLRISWTAVKDVAGYIISIEQDELKAYLTVRVPKSVTTFAVPDGFLARGKQYELHIGTVTEEGNISFVYTWFITAE